MTGRLLEAMAHAGARRYGGERVSELDHALQCAELAEAGGADEQLTLACLLHDVGRFVVDQSLVFDRVGGARSGARGHHPGYHATLSPASQHTLTLQGGPMGAEEIACLDGHAWLADALRLRRWDDGAKVAGRVTRPLESWMPLVRSYFG